MSLMPVQQYQHRGSGRGLALLVRPGGGDGSSGMGRGIHPHGGGSNRAHIAEAVPGCLCGPCSMQPVWYMAPGHYETGLPYLKVGST